MLEQTKIKQRHVVIDWSDVKHKFLQVVGDGKPWVGKNSTHHTAIQFAEQGKGNPHGPPKCKHQCQCAKGTGYHCTHLRRKSKYNEKTQQYEYTDPCPYCVFVKGTEWTGGSYGNTLDNLRDGYRAEEFLHSAAYVPMAPKKRPTWKDEPDGDLEMSRLYGGYDDYYMAPADEDKKPGIRIMVEFAFACGVSNSVIQQYGAWVAGLIGALESTGYDLEVDMWIQLDNLFIEKGGDEYGGGAMRDNVLVRVKRPNEVSDFTEWSALFAPTGYRHLGFCAKMVAGDKIGKKCSSGLGTTLAGKGWDLEYDKDDSILRIRVDQRGHGMYGGDAFPKDKLNEKAVELGLIPEAVK